MTREQQQAQDPRYSDWRQAYREDVVERVKHWGDRRKRGSVQRRAPQGLDTALFAPGRGE